MGRDDIGRRGHFHARPVPNLSFLFPTSSQNPDRPLVGERVVLPDLFPTVPNHRQGLGTLEAPEILVVPNLSIVPNLFESYWRQRKKNAYGCPIKMV
ncbi:protein of unknown function [Magnetospirillum gryphiswaldense MSR-1 v2]|uniref:Uncharacterized protein n=1 Tax=Magnetospirillum gryphiswaldense (strain DSM 6361 / JCM 21280 / NBRC 15271 / MSR-1) TaxID=431944 RepID=V6F699_MAGGM|nr:protein of unknown function [Magnetospirillum gryphiswaldense MSR-1 v2]